MEAPMFGCIVAGRLVQTNLQQVDMTKYVFELEQPAEINHIVVFMTGAQPFPPGLAATVHFLWPSLSRSPQWQFLGMISNEKPSAIFKLGGKKVTSAFAAGNEDAMQEETLISPGVAAMAPAQLGISIEPVQVVQAQVEVARQAKAQQPANTGALVKNIDPSAVIAKLLEHFYNHCASFAGHIPLGGSALFGLDWNTTYIPLKALQDWYHSMQRKLKTDPSGVQFMKAAD
ncbi:hypothetical protein BC832DRAFT_22303 [Gaertneriomyces semiglobifer]|nr:hypothetical protein BC832DRAFT_22303 [Gaertneriomyces semiglobifer]